MGVLAVMPNPGEHSSGWSTRGSGSEKEKSSVESADLKFDQDTHAYRSRRKVRRQQLVSMIYFDSPGKTTIYF